MAWVKLDDQAPRNRKILKAGPAAAWMWVCGIAHCQAHMSEGFIDEIAIPMVGITGAARSLKLADVLVKCGLFERVEGGYMVHDYLEHNETREEAMARKVSAHAGKVAAGRAGGIASGISRSNEAKAKQVLEAKRSPDPTRPDLIKNPLTPFQGGRRRKRKDGVHGSVCAHEPQCQSFTACRDRILLESRAS